MASGDIVSLRAFLVFDDSYEEDGVLGRAVISKDDLTRVITGMQKYEPTDEEVERTLKSMVPHHESDRVDFPSFLWYKIHDKKLRQKSVQSKDIVGAFKYLDQDKDGFLGINDLAIMFKQLDVIRTRDQLEETLAEADADGDGRVSFDDFKKTMLGFIPNVLRKYKLQKGLSCTDCYDRAALSRRISTDSVLKEREEQE